MIWSVWENMDEQEIHVIPKSELKNSELTHEVNSKCFCEPRLDHQNEETGKKVFIHKSDEELNQ